MAKKTNPTPAKTAKKKTVTMADLHKQQDRIEDRLKQMEERLHASITQREPLFENIERMVNKTAYGVRDQGKAFDQRLSAIERLLAMPQDVTGSPDGIKVTIPEQGLEAGDYTDASKEVADALTAMGWEWYSTYRDLAFFGSAEWENGTIINHKDKDVNLLSQAEFLRRASVTAKKLGLVAKEEEPKPWKPEVGKLAALVPKRSIHLVSRVVQDGRMAYLDGDSGCIPSDWLLEPTPEEVAKYHEDIEAAKPVVPYVTRVMYEGYEYMMVGAPDELGNYFLHRGGKYVQQAKRHEFTVID